MKLLLRRSQKAAMLMGSPTFILDVRAEVTPDEEKAIDKYFLAPTCLYSHDGTATPGPGIIGFLASELTKLSVTVGDLMGGKRINCKDIVQMLAVEEQIKEAARNFKRILDAAAHFGGEEIVTL